MKHSNSRLRAVSVVSFAAALALGVSACSSGSSGGDSSTSASPSAAITGEVKGSLQIIGSEPETVYAPMIAGFEAANPGVKVTYTSVPFLEYTSVLQQRLGAKDTSIDVYAVDQPTISSLAARGFLQDVSQISDKVKASALPSLYDVNVYDGKLVAAPISTSTQFMFYNVDLLKKAGVTPPSSDPSQRWTWEQTTEAAKKVQSAGAQWGLILEQIELYYQLQPLPESLGGGSGLTGDGNLTPAVNNEQWVKAFSWYQSLFADKVSPRGVGPFETSPLFSSGKTAFFVGGPWDVGGFGSVKGLNWGMAPMPYFEGSKAVTPNGGWSLGINPASENQATALAFLEYASTTADGNLLFSKNSSNLPANADAFNSYLPTLSGIAGDKSAQAGAIVQYEANNTAVPRPSSVGYTQFETVINKAFADIRNGSDAKTRLDQAQDELTRALANIK
jgi:multiple sugar transport system substrate-binding protein